MVEALRDHWTEGAYNLYILPMGRVTSVETLIIPSREAANDPFVVGRIRRAEALFIAGGDQSDYVNYWKGTRVDAAIAELSAKNTPIGPAAQAPASRSSASPHSLR